MARKQVKARMQLNMAVNEDRSTSHKSMLPMSSADAHDSEQFAAMAIRAVNAQLDWAKSDLRLVAYDVKKKEYVQFTEAE